MSNYQFLEELFLKLQQRAKDNDPKQSYTAHLLNLDSESVAKKLMEEAFEVSLANVQMDQNNNKDQVIFEAADLTYHLMVLLVSKKIDFQDVINELEKRNNKK